MKIKNTWTLKDEVSGLKLQVKEGEALNCLTIEHIGKPIRKNRDFWFTKDGKFDGTSVDLTKP